MCSNGVTSETICTPAAAKSGRPAGKRSSTIHCVNGSVTTGHASVMPSADEISDRSMSVVSGTIRSTMVEGKATSASIHLARSRDRKAANCVTIRPTVWPLAERLSHDSTVKGAAPAVSSSRQRGDQESDGRARRVRILQVMNDVGMAFVQIAGLRRVAVALLGDRQRDDARGRVGHACDQRPRDSRWRLRRREPSR